MATKKRSKRKFMQHATERMEKKGTKGLFARKAKRAGMSTAAYARKEQGAPGKLGKEARFAKMAMHLPKRGKGRKGRSKSRR